MNLVFLFFILLLQWLATDAEEDGCNMNVIKNLMEFYGYPYIADAEDAETYSLSDDSPPKDDGDDDDDPEDSDLLEIEDGSNDDEGFHPRNDDKFDPTSDFSASSNDSPQSGGSPHIHYHHHENGRHHHLQTRNISEKKPCLPLAQLRKLIAWLKQRYSKSNKQPR
ncbi:hypothetical protein AVEN_263210-1 [Araneus ventricosus]|uniref:Uncharacterized protein n=1 Tax=Araneus ventricosus TaxID=182803 RepID=A0A4Y2LY16_ARAVE|nr:hypothetical protein AVEN_263210-1 [Araneus ventricosus]